MVLDTLDISGSALHFYATPGNCDIFVKQKISVINEMKQVEISFKLNVCDRENLCGIP